MRRNFLKLLPSDEDACELVPASCLRLGHARLHGPGGVDANLSRSIGAFRRACEGREREGCYALAVLSIEQAKAAGEASKAVTHLQSGCSAHGHVPSCLALATLHALGEGVTRDLTRAREYVRRSCGLGHSGACMVYGEAVGREY